MKEVLLLLLDLLALVKVLWCQLYLEKWIKSLAG